MLPLKLNTVLALLFFILSVNGQGVKGVHVWHVGHINCYNCTDQDACGSSLGVLRKCENNAAQHCVAVFNAAGAVIQRGCSDALVDVCNSASGNCYSCSSHGCNTQTTNKELVECVLCDAASNENCVFNVAAVTATRKCHQSCITALYPRTSAANAPLELVRSCLDDLDMDEREACATGANADCVACTTGKCNTLELGERNSCYQCSGDDCKSPYAQKCRAVSAGEQCYIEFDENENIVQLGCSSQFDPEELVTLVQSKRLWRCEGENCNRADSLPTAQNCAVCSSRTDPNCAIAPQQVTSETTCNQISNTDCYARILEDGHTERGCAASLEGDDYFSCVVGANATQCATCSGTNCNQNLHPANRLSCHICSSEDDSNCVANPSSAQTCLLYAAEQQCVSSIDVNGYTVRGCSSNLKCDPSDPSKCQHCTGANCNTANLQRKLDGQPGIWQDLPLSCQSCSSVTECAASSSATKCTAQEYCVTVFEASGAVAARGCSNAIEQVHGSYCDQNADKCYNCNSNECNRAVSLADYVECVYCHSSSNAACALNALAVPTRRQCNGQCMTALQVRPNSTIYDVVRSCLDDKDQADRITCSAGNDKECVACSSVACNTVKMPEERLSCFTCNDHQCDEAVPSPCANYAPDDKCYTLYDDLADIAAMGCYSDLSQAFIEENIQKLFTCDTGDACNSFENTPTPNVCVVCSSNDFDDCAVSPEAIRKIDTCNVLPNTGCMTRVLSDGSTERGCVSSLAGQQLKNCLLGTGNCLICNGDLCNQVIYPADRRRCLRCNSVDDPQCESGKAASSVCPQYREEQGCSAKLVDGETYRGCETEFICDDFDKQYCRNCNSSDNCNIVDLVSSNIGYPGKWQTQPINCYTCFGPNCRDGSLGALQKCQNNDAQNCATVFASNGTVVQRSCSDLVYTGDLGQYCDENSEACKFCKSSGCNDARDKSVYVDCLICDGLENGDCVSKVETITRKVSCQQSCFTGLYPRTSATDSALELARGCLDDLELDDREDCASGEKPYCQACDGASCNTAAVPAKRLSCLYCSGDNCATETSKECTSFRENDQCYIHVGDLRIESMGCASDLEGSFLRLNNRDLFLCDGDNCNDKSNLNLVGVSCQTCQSNETSSCIGNALGSNGVVCEHYLHPQCITHITEDGVLVRGCLMDASDELFEDCLSGNSNTCEVCDTNQCNVQVYPPERRSCLRCDSANDANCERSPQSSASYCPIYNANEACVAKVERTRTTRGCQSEIYCNAENDNCRICNDDNCNDVNLLADYVGEPGKWQTLPLNCLVCDGAEECAKGSTLHKCQNNNRQVCATVFDESNQVVKRGCSDAVQLSHGEHCDQHPDNCFKCKSNGCNVATGPSEYIDCYFCDGDEDSSCGIENPTASTRTRKCHKYCMSALYPRSSANDTAYIATHSCLDDLDLDDRDDCAAGSNKDCKACGSDLCNAETIIEDPHECFVCAGIDCEDITSVKCKAYRPNDQCYLAFVESSVVEMGCASDFETQVINELVKQQQLLLCDGKNCNTPNIIPSIRTCSTCNSVNDARCATNPNTIFTTERCSQLPYTQCVTRVDKDGYTQRGCLSALESEVFYGCLTGSDGLCEPCAGDKCNGLSVFPENRLKCHQCDSTLDPNCASAPSSNSFCPRYVENDACVTLQRGDVTLRGCNSTFTCDDPNDSRVCRICRGDGCNTVDLEKANADGVPGIWQPVPITCHTCASEADCASGTSLQLCTNNIYQNCMTVFNTNGKVVQRGCSDAVLETLQSQCDADPKQCPRCNSNGCNVATSLDQYVECVACDSFKNGNCVQQVEDIKTTRQCYKSCMTALYPLFHEENDAYGLIRSCQDDMEEDDRVACEAGNKEHCAACSTGKCNVKDLVDNRLSCNICKGDACKQPTAQLCPTYREGDQCYIEFDETQSVVGLGCLSQYSTANTYNLLKSKRLVLCEEDNCNTLESLPDAKTCKLCSSRTDVACATNPTNIWSETDCVLDGFPHCYSRVLDDGATERGCLSSLDDDVFLSCYNGTSSSCQACLGDSCNNAVYPTGRRSCHICDSQNDANCEVSPNSLGICPLYEDSDLCVSTWRNGVTYRGCASSVSCDENDSNNCVKCAQDGCNTIDLASQNDDNFGKWQDLPLTCLTCSGDACNSAQTTTSETCRNNNEQDCVTVFDSSGKVVRRGCADAIAASCATGSCFKCKSNNCNSANSKMDFVECVYCDSFKDINCLWEPTSTKHRKRQCQGGCMAALYPAYDSNDSGLDIIRTCLNDKEVADQSACSAGSDGNCTACTSNNCNVGNVPANRLDCYTCDGNDCESPEIRPCALYKENDQCFTKFDEANNIDQMGCLSSFRNQDLVGVIKTKRVTVCLGTACNKPFEAPTPSRCAVCNSTESEICATNPAAVGTLETCDQLPYSHCVTRLESDGSTTRGCLYDLPQNDFAACVLGTNENCTICAEDGCNRELFPADRLQCYICSSETDSECHSLPWYALACPIVSDGESCITSLSNNVTTRGCSSHVECDNANDYASCRSCKGNECNGIDLLNRHDDGIHGWWQPLPLKCHACEGEHCKHSLGPAAECNGNIQQDCKTVFESDGQTVRRRGCADDVDDYESMYCAENPKHCFTCKSNECNIAWNTNEFVECAYCNTETDPLCATNPGNAGFATRQCQGECMVSLKSAQLIRSCLNDKEEVDRTSCNADQGGKECARCESAECNKFVYPADRLKCHICTGSTCTSTNAEHCLLYDENDFCFAKYEHGNVDLMGCGSSQNRTQIDEWTAENKLYRCEGNDCNDLDRLPKSGVCLSCDSSKTPDCAQNPSQVTTTETCIAPQSSCVTRLNEAGHTIRGCLNSLIGSEQSSCVAAGTCASCAGDRCNNEVFPNNRRKCHICKSTSDVKCAEHPDSIAICPIYKANDSCVSKNTDGIIERGCGSEITCDASDEAHCHTCSSDACNTNAFTDSAVVFGGSLLFTLIIAFVTTFMANY